MTRSRENFREENRESGPGPAMNQKPRISVVVTHRTEPLNFDTWARRYVALLLEAEGYPVPPYQEAA